MKIYIIVMGLYTIGYAFVRWSVGKKYQRFIDLRFFACLALTTLAVVLSRSGTIYGIACILIFVATVRDRLDATCRLVMMSILTPAVSIKIYIGKLYLVGVGTVEFLTIAFAIALLIRPARDPIRPLKRIVVEDGVMIVLFAAMWIGVTRFPSITITGRAGIEQALITPIPYLLLRRAVRSTEEVRIVAMAAAVATMMTSFVALYESRMKWLPIQLMAQHLNPGEYGLSLIFRGNLLRPVTSTGNPLMLAAVLVMGITAAACSRDFFRSKARYWMSLCLLLLTLILAQSRGNLIVLGLSCAILLALTGRRALAAGITIVGLGMYEGLLLLAPRVPQVAAFLGLNEPKAFGGHFDYRGLLLQRGLQEAAKHPWLGASLDDVLGNLADLVQGQHIVDFVNTYLFVYLVSGLVGVGSLLLLMVIVLKRLVWLRAKRVKQLVSARALVAAAFVAVAAELSFMSYVGTIPLLLMLILVFSRVLQLDRKRMTRRPTPAPAAGPNSLVTVPA